MVALHVGIYEKSLVDTVGQSVTIIVNLSLELELWLPVLFSTKRH